MMKPFHRRHFIAGIGSLSGAYLLGQDKPVALEDVRFKPDTLFLTWQQDPTTTITIQWAGRFRDVDEPVIRYRERSKSEWTIGPVAKAKAFPVVELPVVPQRGAAPAAKPDEKPALTKITGPTDFNVFRAELSKLTPGTEYEFIIGTNSVTYRFRTMPTKNTKAFHFISGGDVGVNQHALANNRIAALQDLAS